MHIFITGGTGFIGKRLCAALVAQGHRLTILSRQPLADTQAVHFCQNLATFAHFNNFDAVINLAGEPIFAQRWTAARKHCLRESRLSLTHRLSELILRSNQPPHTFLSASATGFYGDLPVAKTYDEQTACSATFTGRLCQEWENAALAAASPHTRVCLLRTGLVLDQSGGALQKILPLYRLGLGGKLGGGKQHWAWISLNDQVRAILFLLNHADCQGAYNLVAPSLMANAQFNRQLARQLKRPALFNVPAWGLKMLLGERSQLLLDNQPLVPQRLLAAGFEFEDRHFRLIE
ncbi:epimerase [[Actinobacillus] muris]|uniref:Epimerase n=1 Tax=Muribacter muris TaxID=67855 RepID=A0A0J5P8Z6_9PAST|nr:TIGR01777 family oxidoreductase [Muribacter muris]KMK51999.1 epimerase [[Actinobacillus] muris] [Muribacter muris]